MCVGVLIKCVMTHVFRSAVGNNHCTLSLETVNRYVHATVVRYCSLHSVRNELHRDQLYIFQ